MPRPRRFRKEDIGDPSNFVHVQHVGFGQKKPLMTQRSLDLDQENCSNEARHLDQEDAGNNENSFQDGMKDFKVERRMKGSRSSLIPRHHRSTTTCIFPESSEAYHSHLQKTLSTNTKRGSDSPSVSSLKPTFGSLLNLSFLPLGLGKSSSKSASVSKSKRASLLNLTASNLFSGQKSNVDGNSDSVHMTGYTRRRSFSREENENSIRESGRKNEKNLVETSKDAVKGTGPSRIPLSKLGRSKSTMSDFNKRPKLRLKILPPPPPPPVLTVPASEDLPSPPPTPLPSPPPSPPKTPQSAPPVTEEAIVVVKRFPRSPPRPRIIPLPSTTSIGSSGPSSPQYLTPTGSTTMLLTNEENNDNDSMLLSPTIPPASTPFFPCTQRSDTPTSWPLQPTWPTPLTLQQTEPTIPEIPSPLKEEMETVDSEYDPAMSIVEGFISNGHGSHSYETNEESDIQESLKNTPNIPTSLDLQEAEPTTPEIPSPVKEEMETLESEYDPVMSIVESFISNGHGTHSRETNEESEITQESLKFPPNIPVTPEQIQEISSVLQGTIAVNDWPNVVKILFQSAPPSATEQEDDVNHSASLRTNEIYESVITKTLELWREMWGNHATLRQFTEILGESDKESADSIKKIFSD